MTDFRTVAKTYDESDGEIESSDDERAALPKPAPEEPKTKRSRCLWTDVALEQSMDIGRSTYVPSSNDECSIERGAESYYAVKKTHRSGLVSDFDDTSKQRRIVEAVNDDLFGETVEIEEFGVGAQNTARPPTEYSHETSRFSNRFRGRGRGRGGVVAYRPRSPSRSSSNHSRDSSSSRQGRGGRGGRARGRGGVQAFKRSHNKMGSSSELPNLLAEGFSLEKLIAADITIGSPMETLAAEACEAMGEKKVDMVNEIIKEIGEGKFCVLFEKMRETEKNGGMMTMTQDRRKTPGGVFMHYVRIDPDISQDFKDRIFGVRLVKRVGKKKKVTSSEPSVEKKDEVEERILKSAAQVLLTADDPEEGELMDED